MTCIARRRGFDDKPRLPHPRGYGAPEPPSGKPQAAYHGEHSLWGAAEAEQNKLQRKWIVEASEQLGDRTPEDVRAWCKLHIGVPIMREGNAEFREKYDRIIKPLPYSVKLECMAEPIDFPVTRQMTTKQKTEYLDGVFKALSEQGVILTMPDGSV